MARVIEHFKVRIRHTDGTVESGISHRQPSILSPLFSFWPDGDERTEQFITLRNVVSVSATAVFKEKS